MPSPDVPSSPAAAWRPEVQALRAVAVALVLAYHVWPDAVPGGYIGVDVFFVVSGFLITDHLVREADRTGRVALARFWARRARRLLPASLLVLALTAVAVLLVVPVSAWGPFLDGVRASALYVQNWHLAGQAVDYLASQEAPTPVQHFWSLSVEEQFYAVWPLLVLAAAAGAAAARRRRRIAAALWVVVLASLAYSLHRTATDPAAAYFVTPTRAWEFGAGGLLALLPTARRARAGGRAALLSWAGLAAVCAAALAFDDATPFPGAAALLPVLGTLAVIHAGLPRPRWSPRGLFGLAPVQRLGDISYSVYLWHWPLLVLAPYALERELGGADRVAIVAATLLLAWLTKVLVEDPFRTSAVLLRRRPRWTFAATAGGIAALLLVTGAGVRHLESQAREAEQRTRATLSEPPPCFGAAARDPRDPCSNPALRDVVVPTPVEARRQRNARCDKVERFVCAFGVPAERARGHVALLGDSHAAHWRAAIALVAERRRWHGLSYTRTSCAFSHARTEADRPTRARCGRWARRDVPAFFRRHPEVRTLFVSQLSGREGFERQVRGYLDAWATLPDTVERIVVLRDPPKTSFHTSACAQRAVDEGADAATRCAVPRDRYLDRDPAAEAARRLRARGGGRAAQVIDLTAVFCGRDRCPAVVGGVLVHRDDNHLTPTFARTLGPLVDAALGGRGGGDGGPGSTAAAVGPVGRAAG